MKKILVIVLAIVGIVGLTIGGFFLYKSSTPEYALAKTIADVKSLGMNGLKPHLTSGAIAKVEAIQDWSDMSSVAGLFSAITKDGAVSFLKSKMAEVNWTVEDILRGKNQANVVIGFDYNNSIVGTIEIAMIKDGHEWKLDSFTLPNFDKLSLW